MGGGRRWPGIPLGTSSSRLSRGRRGQRHDSATPPEWRKDALPLLLFLVLPLLAFPELFLGENTVYRGDLTWIHYPLRILAAEQWKSGQVPLWNPYVLSGAPLLAEQRSAFCSR